MSEQPEQIRDYTLARKFPFFVGKLGDWRLPGGPYTLTQMVTAAVVAGVGKQSMWLWARGMPGLIAWFLLLLVAAAAGFLVGKIPLGGRNPLLVLLGIVNYADAPTWGAQRGKAISLRKTARIHRRSSLHVDHGAVETTDLLDEPPRADPTPDVLEDVDPVVLDPAPATPISPSLPLPATSGPAAHQLDEVQRILAASAQRR